MPSNSTALSSRVPLCGLLFELVEANTSSPQFVSCGVKTQQLRINVGQVAGDFFSTHATIGRFVNAAFAFIKRNPQCFTVARVFFQSHDGATRTEIGNFLPRRAPVGGAPQIPSGAVSRSIARDHQVERPAFVLENVLPRFAAVFAAPTPPPVPSAAQ